jgi:2-polyprenyl-6-hydroxyphenyl methylase/3-demethylubiquinone-9 3-methyltransferase
MGSRSVVNNAVYEELGARWYYADDDPVALLRAEARARNPWIAETIARERDSRARVLDVGCGAGFLANDLGARGFDVVGLDLADDALAVAAAHDETKRVRWRRGEATLLPFERESFDAVCAMDLLEHVDRWQDVVKEAARVLAPGGLFFFHTFDRSFFSWLFVIKGVEWFVRNVPRDMHVLRHFIKPRELTGECTRAGLDVASMRGLMPNPLSRPFLEMLMTGIVSDDFEFRFSERPGLGYCGYARK